MAITDSGACPKCGAAGIADTNKDDQPVGDWTCAGCQHTWPTEPSAGSSIQKVRSAIHAAIWDWDSCKPGIKAGEHYERVQKTVTEFEKAVRAEERERCAEMRKIIRDFLGTPDCQQAIREIQDEFWAHNCTCDISVGHICQWCDFREVTGRAWRLQEGEECADAIRAAGEAKP